MATFQYCYIDSKNKKKKGALDALNLQEAKEKLRSQKLLVLSIEENKKIPFFKRNQGQLTKENLITFTGQLAELLGAGVPLYESLLSLEEQYRSESFHPLLLNLCEKIKGGSSLTEALAAHPKSFSKLYTAMVYAGESLGSLDGALHKLAQLLMKENKLKKSLITALIYPALLFCFSCVVVFVLLTFVIPSLKTLFEGKEVNLITKIVILLSDFLTKGWPFYLPVLGGSFFGGYYFFSRDFGKKWVEQKLLQLPFLKTVVIHSAMARFSRTMGTLLQGGVSIIQALQISRKVMRNYVLEEIIENAEKKIVEGSLLSQELKKSKIIPLLVPRMLSIGEEGGNLHVMLHKIADFYEDEVEKILVRLTAFVQPVILVVMGVIVGMIMLATLLPLTDVSAFT